MRTSHWLASIALIAASFTASANTYVSDCYGSLCLPFTQTNAYVQGLAVATAQANNASPNDTIVVSFEPHKPSSCEFRHMIWTVASAPVTQYQNLTFNQQICEKAGL
jgi:hypothetical protein